MSGNATAKEVCISECVSSTLALHWLVVLPPEYMNNLWKWNNLLERETIFTKGKLSPLKTIFQKKYSYINLLERKFFLRWNTSHERNYFLKRKILFSTRNYLLLREIFIPERKIFSKKNLRRRKIKSVTVKKIPDTVVKYYCVWYLFNCNTL